MLQYVKIKTTGPTPGMVRRDFNRIAKRAYYVMGRYWQRRMLQKHFTTRARKTYDYEPRSGEPGRPAIRSHQKTYTGRKQTRFGHSRPLVWTGFSKARSRSGRITATSKRVTVRVNAPVLAFRTVGGRIPMAEEVTRVTDSELDTLATIFDQKMEREFKKRQSATSTRLIRQ